MRLLVPLLVMAGVLAACTGLLQMAFNSGPDCVEDFKCEKYASVDNALAGAAFFSIAVMLWGIAGTLVWMRRKFDESPY